MLQQTSSPVGKIWILADKKGVQAISFSPLSDNGDKTKNAELHLKNAAAALKRYFKGDLKAFSRLKFNAHGTEFQERVWKLLAKIPAGKTRSYQDLALQLKKPKAARAIGAACGKNPLLIAIPCHRVIASSGKMSGFAAGVSRKRKLLNHEGVRS